MHCVFSANAVILITLKHGLSNNKRRGEANFNTFHFPFASPGGAFKGCLHSKCTLNIMLFERVETLEAIEVMEEKYNLSLTVALYRLTQLQVIFHNEIL